MNNNLGLAAPMNPTETIRETIPIQNPVGSAEIPSLGDTEVEVQDINILAQQNSSPNAQNPQTLSAIKNGTVEQNSAFYSNPNEISSILDEKSGGNYSVNIKKINQN